MAIEAFIRTPIGTEIFLAGIGLLSFFILLLLFSTIFRWKKQIIVPALYVSMITAGVFFLIRSINILFDLTQSQTALINTVAWVAEFVVLIVMIKHVYRPKWGKTILTGIITFVGRLAITGVTTMIVLVFFTTVLTDIYEE